jgi:hypothetical protein
VTLITRRARIDLLFTMSDITRTSTARRSARILFLTNEISNEQGPSGGARRDRTDDLLLAKQALSQLSYGPLSGIRYQPMPGVGGPGKI